MEGRIFMEELIASSSAYDVYRSLKHVGSRGHFAPGVDLAAKYRSMFGISRPVNVHFIGVW